MSCIVRTSPVNHGGEKYRGVFRRFFAPLCIAWLCLGNLCEAATVPAIVPLPQQMTNRPGVFTLCSGQVVPGVTAQPLIQILCDPSSFQNAQYLAGVLFRATGFQFSVSTNSGAGPVRNAV